MLTLSVKRCFVPPSSSITQSTVTHALSVACFTNIFHHPFAPHFSVCFDWMLYLCFNEVLPVHDLSVDDLLCYCDAVQGSISLICINFFSIYPGVILNQSWSLNYWRLLYWEQLLIRGNSSTLKFNHIKTEFWA